MSRLNAMFLPLVFLFAGCGLADEAREKMMGKALTPEYAADFSRERTCDSTDGAERKLVRSFILSISNYLPEEERFKTSARFLKRLALKKEDPFSVYRDFRKGAYDRIMYMNGSYGPPIEGWAIMERYAKERPDYSRSVIKCTVASVDLANVKYVGRELIRFATLPGKDSEETIGVLTENVYIQPWLADPDHLSWAFGVEKKNRYVESITWVGGGGGKLKGLESVPEKPDQKP